MGSLKAYPQEALPCAGSSRCRLLAGTRGPRLGPELQVTITFGGLSMKSRLGFGVMLATVAAIFTFGMATLTRADAKKAWSIKADYIEACSCHLFCSCYFYARPEGGHMCEFNNAIRVASGNVGDVKLDGCLFWMSGDLGGDFSKGEMKSAVITFDPKVTKEQRDAILVITGKLYPVHFQKMETDEAKITWEQKADGSAHATLGDKAEVTLTPVKDGDKQAVLTGVKYWGAARNDGFRLCRSTHWYKGHGFDYRHEDKNGFTIHLESEGVLDEKP